MADIMAEQLPALSEREQGVLKERIVAKLKELDLYQDDVLPQYVCVMVKNRKEPKEIIEQLEFFVGDVTETFVKWMVDVITSGELRQGSGGAVKRPAAGVAEAEVQKKKKAAAVPNGQSRASAAGDEDAAEGGDHHADAKRPCMYYPNCKNGAKCPFVHPDPALLSRSSTAKPCKNFPTCQFGDMCTFLHARPDCRFGPMCTNQGCHFNHREAAGMMRGPYGGGGYGGGQAPVCRFFPNCTNAACSFQHPPPCKFGASCTRIQSGQCHFYHAPESSGGFSGGKGKVPCKFGDSCTKNECSFYHASLGGPKHISDRAFVLEEEEEGGSPS